MKKFLIITLFLVFIMFAPSKISAQNMMGGWISSSSPVVLDDHTAREEAEGKVIWEKLQKKQLECKNLTDDNYEALGEYFMGQSIGNTQRHAVMNQRMKNMMGEEGEEQMHIAMGKRLSGCDVNAPYPQNGWGLMPMIWMMEGGGNPMMGYGGWGNMMGWSFGIFGWLFMLIFWAILILGVIALIRYLRVPDKRDNEGKSSLDILKERYAKGEINKKEFEEMKKDLS